MIKNLKVISFNEYRILFNRLDRTTNNFKEIETIYSRLPITEESYIPGKSDIELAFIIRKMPINKEVNFLKRFSIFFKEFIEEAKKLGVPVHFQPIFTRYEIRPFFSYNPISLREWEIIKGEDFRAEVRPIVEFDIACLKDFIHNVVTPYGAFSYLVEPYVLDRVEGSPFYVLNRALLKLTKTINYFLTNEYVPARLSALSRIYEALMKKDENFILLFKNILALKNRNFNLSMRDLKFLYPQIYTFVKLFFDHLIESMPIERINTGSSAPYANVDDNFLSLVNAELDYLKKELKSLYKATDDKIVDIIYARRPFAYDGYFIFLFKDHCSSEDIVKSSKFILKFMPLLSKFSRLPPSFLTVNEFMYAYKIRWPWELYHIKKHGVFLIEGDLRDRINLPSSSILKQNVITGLTYSLAQLRLGITELSSQYIISRLLIFLGSILILNDAVPTTPYEIILESAKYDANEISFLPRLLSKCIGDGQRVDQKKFFVKLLSYLNRKYTTIFEKLNM